MARFVIDTHALLFYLGNATGLGTAVESALDDPVSELILPAIALAEALWIVSNREVGVSAQEVMERVDNDPRTTVAPLTRDVVVRAHELSGALEMHDRQIVATALLLDSNEHPITVLTKDKAIVTSELVRTDW